MGIPGKDVCPKGHQGFESLPLRKKVKSCSVGEIASSQTTSGGRGGIPPQTPPSAPPASLLDFFGIFGIRAKVARGEKTRARSRTRGFSPSITFFIANINRNHHSGSKRPTSASSKLSGAPAHISERLPRFPPSLIATEGRVRHTDMCLARRTVDERSGSRPLLDRACGVSGAMHVMHRLHTDFLKKYFLTPRKNGKMYL